MKDAHKIKTSSSEAAKLRRKKAAAERKKLLALSRKIRSTNDSCEPVEIQRANRNLFKAWEKIYAQHNKMYQ